MEVAMLDKNQKHPSFSKFSPSNITKGAVVQLIIFYIL